MNAPIAKAVLSIAMTPVESSQIAAIGYDADSKTLAVQFPGRGPNPGDVYHYFGVEPQVFTDLLESESKGKFFGANIKGKYIYEKQPGADGIAFGLKLEQEPKYTTDKRDGRICNRATGKPIPDDEPIFILRAKDMHATTAMVAYLDELTDPEHRAAVQARIEAFEDFAEKNPDKVKVPDTVAA